MRGKLDSFKEQRRRQKFVEGWSQIRAKGAFKFGLKVTTIFSLSVFVPVSAIEFFVDGIVNRKTLLMRLISSVVSGVVLSAISWWTSEGRYKNIMIDNRIRERESQ